MEVLLICEAMAMAVTGRLRRALQAYQEARRKYRPGQGGRFRALVGVLTARGYSLDSARRIAAAIGQRKYGAQKMAQWARSGR